jgi:hypothetical protein
MATTKSEAERLDSTLSLLETNVEKQVTSGAPVKISGWIRSLENRKGFKGITGDLEKLKKVITEKDNPRIIALLEKLGDATIAAAEKAANDDTPMVKKLGKALLKTSKVIKTLVG